MALGNHYLAASPIIKPVKPIKKYISLLVGLLLAFSSQSFAQSDKKLPWFLGFSAPAYMEVWIETADVVDIKERVFRGAGGGIASVPKPPNNQGIARGWVSSNGAGKGRYVTGADLPRLIYVRWQSLAEPQTYEAYIVIPESAREIMRKPEKAFCSFGAEWITESRDNIGIGLAPGGIAKVWLGGACLNAIEILRVAGTVNTQGPSQGKNEGRYALLLSPESKTYIDKFGIPYGSW
ncbi:MULTISPECIES: DUF2931 family protein [Pseudomonas]|uniref:Uncharacterized protein n=1 Tax=Pseudomonas umsongensis TaxID=198618 RepID=A0ACC5MK00_9PSED|nr:MULTISPECIES: DUF2931 family protein [Pseudomonas]MBB2888903.1 hypothetical protein [Pseudomonas umsongensis]NMN78024.1 Protein of unknown function (DUF2931) [Pseudomonas sp. KD5]